MKALMIFAVLSTVTVLTASIAEEVKPVEVTSKNLRVYEDRRLTSMCVVGAMAGAFMAIAIWPVAAAPVEGNTPEERACDRANKEKAVLRMLSLKFGVSMFSGCTLTPMIMTWRQWELNTDLVLGTATLVSASFVYLIHKMHPIVDKLFQSGQITDILLRFIGKGTK